MSTVQRRFALFGMQSHRQHYFVPSNSPIRVCTAVDHARRHHQPSCSPTMRSLTALLCSFGLSIAVIAPAQAATASRTVVMAKDIGDIVSLDPAEVFELSAGEVIANIYDRIMMFEPDNLKELVGGVAESHAISADGKTITFKVRPDLRFHSGNPVRPEDVEFSLERVVKLNKTPAFIVNQFGWTPDTVEQLVEVVDDRHVSVTLTADFSPDLVLNALSAGIASVVDKELVLSHEQDGDLGHGWLQTNSAGSGPFQLQRWQVNDAVVLNANPDYRHGAPQVEQVVLRHAPEVSRQQALLEQGDVDMARDLAPAQIQALATASDIAVDRYPTGGLIYLAANASHPVLGNPKVVQALRHAVDYAGMAESFLAGQYVVHQAFWPKGLWAAYTETPYRLDLPAAKALLTEAGYGQGFTLHIDTINQAPYPAIARSIQASLSQLGIKAVIRTYTGTTFLPHYRSRQHELILAPWSPDYVDPHSNADSFAYNPDNRETAQLGGVVAWRNAWVSEPVNAMVLEARQELNRSRREQLYLELQKRLQHEGPYVILFQQNRQVARRQQVHGLIVGSNFDLVYYRTLIKSF